MRKQFAELVYDEMTRNNEIYVVTGDLGYGLWDKVRDSFPGRFFNVGSSEMAMMGMAIGLAMEGKIPFVYSISPFAIYRPFEMIRNYLSHENIPVNIIGGGRDRDYGYLGFSHWADDDKKIMTRLENLKVLHPTNEESMTILFRDMINNPSPTYMNLKK